MRKKTKRIYGILLSMSMLLTLLSVPVWAAEPVETGAGYEQKEEQIHEHTEDCYTLTENCVHEHTTECYPQTTGTGTVSGNDITETIEDQPTECTHVCSEESGCITKERNCGYNTENNGTPATVGTTQGTGTVEAAEQEAETVTVESVQAMIDALPDAEEISTNNAEEVAEQLEAIDRAKTKLSDEEIDTLDFSKYMKAAAALGELSIPMLTANGTGEVSTAADLTAALANSSISKITLIGNIDISSTLMVNRTVTLDLKGCVLNMTGSGSVIRIQSGGLLIIEDSSTNISHNFTPDSDGLWVLDNTGSKTVSGGVITGGKGTQVSSYGAKGGGVYIEPAGSLVMNGGSIVGCTADYGGGVQMEYDGDNKKYSAFTMNGGSIVGCKAHDGGGVVVEEGCNFIMNSGSEISYCTAKENAYNGDGHGGGVMINSGYTGTGVFTMNGGKIHSCTADNNSGGVDNAGKFVMTGGQIYGCTAKIGGGVRNGGEQFIMSGGKIGNPDNNDTSDIANYSGSLTISDNAEIHTNVSILNGSILNADGGVISGNVTNGDRDNGSGTITGSKGAAGSTRFSGSVTNNSDYRAYKSIIEKGTFTGSVTNNDGCMILGGDFNGATSLSGELEITFEPGNGDPDITQTVLWKNDGEKLTEPSLVKKNYTIEGWYYDDNGTEKKWDFGNDRTIYTMTLKAKWKPNTYTVKLEANGGTIANGKEVTDYTYGTDVTLPTKDDIIRKGYTFEGWYTDSGFSGSPVTGISSTDGGNKTFYAKWKQNTTPVTPGETEPKDTNHDNISRNNTNPNNTDYYDTGDTNESSGTAPVIYPALTFDTCGGSSIKAVRAFEGHTINLSGYLPTREGYQFSGWYADQNLTQPVTEIRLDGNRTVYAGWIKQAEQAGESSKPKAAPAQLIADNNEKAVSKDSSQSLIEDYKPGSTDTLEDQITEDQATEGQSTEDTGNDQKPTVDNSPADNDSKPDDSADLAPEKTSGNNVGILIACAFAGTALIGVIIYIIYKKGNKGRRL